MSVDVEEANHLLRLASSVDVQTWNAALFYHLHSPLNDTCIDGLPGWKTVYRRAVCRLDNENVAPVRLGRFCRQGINAVNVSCVQDGGRWCGTRNCADPSMWPAFNALISMPSIETLRFRSIAAKLEIAWLLRAL